MTLELKPNRFFDFFSVTQNETQHAGILAAKLADAFSATGQTSGDGVKSITVTLILTDPKGLGKAHKPKGPRYTRGVQTIRAHGLTFSFENALEFTLQPSYESVSQAATEADLARAILPAIIEIKPELERLRIAGFDMKQFVSNLVNFFSGVAERDGTLH